MPKTKRTSTTRRRDRPAPIGSKTTLQEGIPIPCPQPSCTKTFRGAESLLDHIMEHISANRRQDPHANGFVCIWQKVDGVCGKSMPQKSNLRTHVKTHMQLKDMSCTHITTEEDGGEEPCGMTFTDPGSLTRHRKMCHGYVPLHKDSVDRWVEKTKSGRPVMRGGGLEWRYEKKTPVSTGDDSDEDGEDGSENDRAPDRSRTPRLRTDQGNAKFIKSTHPDLRPSNYKDWMNVGERQPNEWFEPFGAPLHANLFADGVATEPTQQDEDQDEDDDEDSCHCGNCGNQNDVFGYRGDYIDTDYSWPSSSSSSVAGDYMAERQERQTHATQQPDNAAYLSNIYMTTPAMAPAPVSAVRTPQAPQLPTQYQYAGHTQAQAQAQAQTSYLARPQHAYQEHEMIVQPMGRLQRQAMDGQYFWETIFPEMPSVYDSNEEKDNRDGGEGQQRIRGWFNVCI